MALLAALAVLSLVAAGCSGTDDAEDTTDADGSAASDAADDATDDAADDEADASDDASDDAADDTADGTADDAGEGQSGGTLRLAGNSDVLYLDPAAAYGVGDYTINRAIFRGLFDYVPDEDLGEATTPRADIAVEVPTLDNGGISEDGLTYTIELRDGVLFNAPDGERQVVAEDVVRGVKRMCNPVQGASPRDYFLTTITGLEEFCTGFADVEPEVEAIREYVEGNEVEGITAVDDSTIEFTLIQPASDFLNILALGKFVSPHPVEYLDYLPDSPELRQNTIATGPYMITEYTPDQRFVLERNPTWDAETDDIRQAYVDRIEIEMGQEDTSVFQQIMAGSVDMQWNDTIVPAAEIPALTAAADERLVIGGDGAIRPYVVINTLSPNADGAFAIPEVRQALNFAIDRAAIQQVSGGPDVVDLSYSIIPPEVPGAADANPLDIPDEGDPERARELLEEAGYPDGVPVKLLYRETQPYRDIATVMEQDLTEAGFEVELIVTTQNAFYGEWLLNQDLTEEGGWDIAPAAWGADYLGGRAYMVPMIDSRGYESGSANFGGYANEEVDAAIDAALAAATPEEANELWAEADLLASEDAAWAPVANARTPTIHSDRVEGFTYFSNPHNGDIVNVWIEE